MKKLSLLIVSLLALNAFPLHAQEVQKQDALAVAQRFLELRSQGQDFTIRSVEGFIPDGHHLAWVINFDPKGFVVVSQTENIRPIMAYSFESPWLTGGKEEQIFLTLMENWIFKPNSNIRCNRLPTAKNAKPNGRCTETWQLQIQDLNNGHLRAQHQQGDGSSPTGRKTHPTTACAR
ncbi:MAG: hypothetical protein B6D64_08670 [Bacteroidetes bacterium 4484_276]|nr:MAG: hypothetical protein B6D64_08670 [Bacteroidetes bacterium 4484_276]